MNYVIIYLQALLALAVYFQGTYGTRFYCDEESKNQGVPYCPRPFIDDSDKMRCCVTENDFFKIYGCCSGLPNYIYIVGAVIAAVIIGSSVVCCCCCCRRQPQNRGFVMFQNPPVAATTVAPPAAQPDRSAGRPI